MFRVLFGLLERIRKRGFMEEGYMCDGFRYRSLVLEVGKSRRLGGYLVIV